MPKVKAASEGSAEERDPFEETTDEALRYVIDRWGYVGGKIVIEGRVTEIAVTMHLKRGDYQSDAISATLTMEPKGLKCDLVVNKPVPEIEETGDDLAIVGLVFRRFGVELALQSQSIMVEHMQRCYPEPEKEGTRVEAGEGRDQTNDQQSVVF